MSFIKMEQTISCQQLEIDDLRETIAAQAAVSKAKLHPSEKQQLKNALCYQTLRCPRCNHEFPHHWAGCGSINSMGE